MKLEAAAVVFALLIPLSVVGGAVAATSDFSRPASCEQSKFQNSVDFGSQISKCVDEVLNQLDLTKPRSALLALYVFEGLLNGFAAQLKATASILEKSLIPGSDNLAGMLSGIGGVLADMGNALRTIAKTFTDILMLPVRIANNITESVNDFGRDLIELSGDIEKVIESYTNAITEPIEGFQQTLSDVGKDIRRAFGLTVDEGT